MIVSFGEPTLVAEMPDGSSGPRSFASLVGGLHDRPAVVAFGTEVHCISVEIDPLASRRLFGCPASALANEVLDVTVLFGADGVQLPDRLRERNGWTDRFEVLDDVLREASRPSPQYPRSELVWAWRQLAQTSGAVGVEVMANQIGWSRRHFTTLFTDEFGIAPRLAKRLFRFDALIKMLQSQSVLDLAGMALACGYADQSHLTNEFRSFAGTSPRAWIDAEFPNFQDYAASSRP